MLQLEVVGKGGMMVIQGGAGLGQQIDLLARRGCAAWAFGLNDYALSRKMVDAARHQAMRDHIGRFPAATMTADFQVYGTFLDSVVTSLHFVAIEDRTLAREAFRQAVRWIEIETSSQCNRRCGYCPNSRFDRLSSNDFLDATVYEKAIRDLAEIDYDGDIKFVGNNEFFMHRHNRAYVEFAHEHLPKCRMTLFSNGDYVKKEDIEWAVAHGVTMIIVTLHPGATKGYDDLEVLRRAYGFQTRTGLALQLRHFKKGNDLHFIGASGAMTVLVGLTDLSANGHNWTGLLPGHEDHQRTDPCTYPTRQFVINYLGDIFMCCVAFKDRSAENAASGAITGNLRSYGSVFQAYTSPELVAWRRSLFHNGAKSDPCKTCSGHTDYVEPKARPLADYINKQLNPDSPSAG